ncbi:helix-turn-helix domain-containing protein [Dialister succinatiphilus]|uniref:helix-turn-helix domain-containing protein n=1 Tax=Dialister succinatiphilus TaxID=487173 RepID=UPI003FEEEDF9
MTKEKFYEEERKLIEKAKGGDRKAMEDLMARYEPLFRKLCAGEPRMDWEDIRQDLAVSFLEGVRAFTPEKGHLFSLLHPAAALLGKSASGGKNDALEVGGAQFPDVHRKHSRRI